MADYGDDEIDYANLISNYENEDGGDSDEYTADSDEDEETYEDETSTSHELAPPESTYTATSYEEAQEAPESTFTNNDEDTYEQETSQYTSDDGTGHGDDDDDDDEYTNDDDDSSSSSSGSKSNSSSSNRNSSSDDDSDDGESSENGTDDFESADDESTSEGSNQSGGHDDDVAGDASTDDDTGDSDSQELSTPDSPDDRQQKTQSPVMRKSSARAAPTASESGSSDGSETPSGSEDYEDEFEPKKSQKRNKLKGKSNKRSISPESSGGSGSWSGSESGSDSESKSDSFDDEYSEESSRRKMKSKKRSRSKSGDAASPNQERDVIADREKLLTDREDHVNTRERQFTKWMLALACLVCIGAGVLIALYFIEPFGSGESSSQRVQVENNTMTPVSPSQTPSMQPSANAPTTLGPTGPDVVVNISFLGLVPGEESATAESVEQNLISALDQLATEILDGQGAAEARQSGNSFLRRRLKAISIRTPVSADVTDVDCPNNFLVQEGYLCFEIDVQITVITNDGTVEQDYLDEIEEAIDSGLLEETYSNTNPDSTIQLYAETFPPSLNATSNDVPTVSSAPSFRGSLSVSPAPTPFSSSPTSINLTISPAPTPMNVTETPSPSLSLGNETLDDDFFFNETISPEPTESPTKRTCEDSNESCGLWSEAGECENNSVWMLENCRLSCGVCEVEIVCEDSDDRCSLWATSGECEANPNYMMANCKLSCAICEVDEVCKDDNDQCAGWASIGECESNPTYMRPNCRESCGQCNKETENPLSNTTSLPTGTLEPSNPTTSAALSGPVEDPEEGCFDDNEMCEMWSSEGECDLNPTFMLVNCKKSCDVCGIELVI